MIVVVSPQTPPGIFDSIATRKRVAAFYVGITHKIITSDEATVESSALCSRARAPTLQIHHHHVHGRAESNTVGRYRSSSRSDAGARASAFSPPLARISPSQQWSAEKREQ